MSTVQPEFFNSSEYFQMSASQKVESLWTVLSKDGQSKPHPSAYEKTWMLTSDMSATFEALGDAMPMEEGYFSYFQR